MFINKFRSLFLFCQIVRFIFEKSLIIKIIEASKSIKNKAIVWYGQISRGIKNILAYAHEGIRKWQKIETREKFKQLQLKL